MYWKRLIATCLGLGWMPVAPGSWGSLPPAVVFGVLMYLCVPGAIAAGILAAMVVAGCVGCVLCGPASIAAAGDQDPGEVVMDEFAGQALAFFVIPLVAPATLCGWRGLALAAIGFLVFRVFDIVKPGPIKKLERLPAGWGILMDDLASGLVSAVFVYVAMRVMVGG